VEVAGHQGTVEGMVQVLPTEGGNMVSVAVDMWGLASSKTFVHPFRNCRYHHHTICIDVTSGPYTTTRWLRMLAGHVLFCCPAFNTSLRWHHLRNEGRTSHNKRGRLPVDTEHSDTPIVLCFPRK
jgi:hypothetical protein